MLSNLCVDQHDLSASEQWLEQILDEYPGDIGAMNDLGYLWADQGKHLYRARKMIEQAVAAEPNNAAYRDSLGWVLYQSGNFDAAVRELEAAAALSRGATSVGDVEGELHSPNVEVGGTESDPPLPGDGIILDHLGDAHLMAGDLKEAIRWWRQALPLLEKQVPRQAPATREKLQQHGAAP